MLKIEYIRHLRWHTCCLKWSKMRLTKLLSGMRWTMFRYFLGSFLWTQTMTNSWTGSCKHLKINPPSITRLQQENTVVKNYSTSLGHLNFYEFIIGFNEPTHALNFNVLDDVSRERYLGIVSFTR